MKDVAKKLKEHAAKPASKAHKGLRAGGKTNLDMKKYGRGMAKVINQRSAGRGRSCLRTINQLQFRSPTPVGIPTTCLIRKPLRLWYGRSYEGHKLF